MGFCIPFRRLVTAFLVSLICMRCNRVFALKFKPMHKRNKCVYSSLCSRYIVNGITSNSTGSKY